MGQKLFLKGERCYDDNKCGQKRRSYPPGHLGRFSRRERGVTEFAVQLREKQKARKMYGVSERQFERYFSMAASKHGLTGELLFQTLERRLDNVVYRLGFGGYTRIVERISQQDADGLMFTIRFCGKLRIPALAFHYEESGDENAHIAENVSKAVARALKETRLELMDLELRGFPFAWFPDYHFLYRPPYDPSGTEAAS